MAGISFLSVLMTVMFSRIINGDVSCSCEGNDICKCDIKTINDQINCDQFKISNPKAVSLGISNFDINRKLNIFSNEEYCNFKRMKISTNKIPPNLLISNLKSLEHLIISDDSSQSSINHGYDIVNLLTGLTELRSCKIENLQIKNWSKQILSDCQLVTKIELKNLQLENVEFDSFVNCKSLESLKVFYNKLNKIFISSFRGLVKLLYLTLSNNLSEDLVSNGNGWQDMKSLEILDLSNNAFSKLPARAFVGLVKLQKLILNDNRLEFIDKTAFESLNNLQYLHMRNNRKLILFDLLTLIPVKNSLIRLDISISYIQCINFKSSLTQFHVQVQTALRDTRNCDKIETSTPITLLTNYQRPEIKTAGNQTLIIVVSVLGTLVFVGLIGFLVYHLNIKRKLRTIQDRLSENCSGSLRCPSQNTMDINKKFHTFNEHSNGHVPLIARFNSTPVLPTV